jgi:hypothetical protein
VHWLIRATCLAHLIFHDFITQVISSEKYKLWAPLNHTHTLTFLQKPLGTVKSLLIITDAITGQCFAGIQLDNALDLYSEYTWVESRPQYRLCQIFRGFPQSFQATAGIITSIRLWPLPSKPFPIHYSPVILPSTLTNVTEWQRR